jgi:hypothetical protein
MKQKDRSLLYLLTFTMLLFSFSSIFAGVTVTYTGGNLPYNQTGQTINCSVVSTEDIAAFDLITKVATLTGGAFGTVTGINVSSVPLATADFITKVDGASEDQTRISGFDVLTPIILTANTTYNFIFTVTTSCALGTFTLDDGGIWEVADPVAYDAITAFVNTSSEFVEVTTVPGTYTVVNAAPSIVNCPQPFVLNACAVLTYQFEGADADIACLTAPDLTFSLVDPEAGMSITPGGLFTYDPPAVAGICGAHSATVKVTDEYGAESAVCTFGIDVVTVAPAFTGCPAAGSELSLFWGETFDGSVTAVDPDAVLPSNGCPVALTYSLVSFTGPITAGPFVVNPTTGVWSWPTETSNLAYQGEHTVVIQVTDGCETATCSFTVYVTSLLTNIAKMHDVIQGHYAFDSVYIYADGIPIGGFDFLIAYDASALTLHEVLPGTEIAAWEYFTYRFGALGNCNGPCPSGLVRVIGIADANNGFPHPPVSAYDVNGLAFILKFLVTNDRSLECQYVPVAFYWLDCGDNVLSSPDGLIAYLSRDVWWYHGEGGLDTWELISDLVDPTVWGGYAGWGGILESPNCLAGQKVTPLAWMDMWDGGIDIVCADSIDARGDLNLNGIANEIADAVIYTQYFLYGIDAFSIGGANGRQASIAASDVNADGTPLSIGDLVYLLRVIVGDALPYAKLAPYGANANVSVFGDKISTESSETIGAMYLTFNVTGDNFTVVNHTNMEVQSNRVGDMLNVLVYSGTTNLSNAIPAGTNELLTVTGAQLNSVEAADYYGNLLNTRVAKSALPTQFALAQNIPNPFNPSTKIGLDLPSLTGWAIDIYNVNGQLVQSYNGTNIGHVEVTWNAANAASGIYFYKVTAGSFTDTKKMVLMK